MAVSGCKLKKLLNVPVRVMVQTSTHLIPGTGSGERTSFMLNLICQYHWNCNFDPSEFRWASYNAQYAFRNKRCVFVVDYGVAVNGDDGVPILFYEWNGEALTMIRRENNSIILERLSAEVPFTRDLSIHMMPGLPMRKIVKSRLHCEETLRSSELHYMRQHPDDLEWLKKNVISCLWQRFVAEMNEKRPPGTPLMRE